MTSHPRLFSAPVVSYGLAPSTTENNGQINQQKDWISGEEITYQYDSLTRLISAATTGPEWGLSFAYDGFGNRTNQTVTKGSGPSSALTYNSLSRINGFNYDNNGNITWMTSGVTLTYDVENRSTTMQGGFGTERYGYDPRNQRVYRKKANGTEEFTLWGAGGERIETFKIVSGAPSWRPDAHGEQFLHDRPSTAWFQAASRQTTFYMTA